MANKTRTPSELLRIWQWNCRSYSNKRNLLHLNMLNITQTQRPQVLALQETNPIAILPGYSAYTRQAIEIPQVTLLFRRNILTQLHNTCCTGPEHKL
ncbi:hypothetical protein HPB48_009091 [Haemaphysalis longicornis]|uniref:Uncharacterized protein n=1 Tax=Haemaphysalis longicornis TaxID=44386 RepID=A0A9J6GAT9_HAELO|nr:hypothetical protein HPB48_009091 [Haemaphysalis longicornis]